MGRAALTLGWTAGLLAPQVFAPVVQGHHFGFDTAPPGAPPGQGAQGHNGKKDANRRHARGRNACGGGRRE